MFKICGSKGFQITFENGWTVSVQFGPGNYCEGYPNSIVKFDAPQKANFWTSPNAEIAAWDRNNEWFIFDNQDQVKGYQTPKEVLEFCNLIASK
jgi:hypothetical protein